MSNERRVLTASKRAVRERNYRRARERALTKLANAYPDHYKELLESERHNDEIFGKKWTDLDGNTAPALGSAESDAISSEDRTYESEGEQE